jgi:hypothetical protein
VAGQPFQRIVRFSARLTIGSGSGSAGRRLGVCRPLQLEVPGAEGFSLELVFPSGRFQRCPEQLEGTSKYCDYRGSIEKTQSHRLYVQICLMTDIYDFKTGRLSR